MFDLQKENIYFESTKNTCRYEKMVKYFSLKIAGKGGGKVQRKNGGLKV